MRRVTTNVATAVMMMYPLAYSGETLRKVSDTSAERERASMHPAVVNSLLTWTIGSYVSPFCISITTLHVFKALHHRLPLRVGLIIMLCVDALKENTSNEIYTDGTLNTAIVIKIHSNSVHSHILCP